MSKLICVFISQIQKKKKNNAEFRKLVVIKNTFRWFGHVKCNDTVDYMEV